MKKIMTVLATAAVAMTMFFTSCTQNYEVVKTMKNPIFEKGSAQRASEYGNEPKIEDELGAKVYKYEATGDYAQAAYIFDEDTNISGKNIEITAKFDNWVKAGGYNGIKIGFSSDEAVKDDKKWITAMSETAYPVDSITSDFVKAVISVDSLVTAWSSDGSIKAADLKKIKTLVIMPQKDKGMMTIQNIKFVEPKKAE